MRILSFDNVFLPVGDLDEAVTFYSGVLGLPVHRRFDAKGMALFRVGDEAPGLGVGVTGVTGASGASGASGVTGASVSGGRPAAGGQKVWLEVADARAAARELSAHGVTPLSAPFEIPTGWAFEFRDPWGNVIGLTDYTIRPDLARPPTP